MRFNDKVINIKSALNLIIAGTSMSGNLTSLTASSSMSDFSILKHFDFTIKPPKPQIIKEVIWNPPIFNWIKCNTDRASLGNPGQAACGGLFRNSSSNFIGGFAVNLGVSSALCSELIGAMLAIEIAHKKVGIPFGWKQIQCWYPKHLNLIRSSHGTFKTDGTIVSTSFHQ